MHPTVHVLNSMIDHLMRVIALKPRIAKHYIGVEVCAVNHTLFQDGPHGFGKPVVDDLGVNLAAALQNAEYDCLPLAAGSGDLTWRERYLCMLRALPPMKVSSTSTSAPPNQFSLNDPVCMARRMRCIMNHADFWVMPRARWIS